MPDLITPMDAKPLTPSREKFAQEVASGESQADAYRAAFKVRKGTLDSSIHVNASKLMANARVVQRVKELRDALQKKQLWSREMSVRALITAYKTGNGSVKVSAVKELNAMHGYNEPEKLDINLQGGVSIDASALSTQALRELINARLKDQ